MSLRRVLTILAVLFVLNLGGPVQAQEYGTLPDSIPDRHKISAIDVLSNHGEASAALRLDVRRLVIENPEESTLYGRRVVTVFEEEGRSYGQYVRHYDTFLEIEELDGRILDAEGKVVKELDDEDIYPYTVEYRYELEVTTPFWWPTWYPEKSDLPTEFVQFEVDAPASQSVRHHIRGDSLEPEVWSENDRQIRRWRVSNRPAYDREPHGPSWREQVPSVHVAPTRFNIADTWGDMRSWTSFGRWYHQLKEGRDRLDAETAREMREIVDGAATKRDSVRRLYRHLQKETRYVSVQLGIGGWQPFPTSYVRERGYGDCKALTNYMEASLKAVGIEAHPVFIYAGRNPFPLLTEFPSHQFNHVVLAVPMEQDTLWLENTDSSAPFGHVPVQNEDRHALMVTPSGGEIVRTPASRTPENQQLRTATVALDPSGSGTASVRTTYTGNQQDRVRTALTDVSPRKRHDWVRARIDVPSFDITSVDFSDVDAYRDTVRLPLELSLSRYASTTGSRLFFPLNLTERWSGVPPEMDGERTQPVHAMPYPFLDVDSIRYKLPDGYEVEAVPEPVTIEMDFATYEASVSQENGDLLYRRRLVWREKTLPPDRYDEFREFRRQVARADQAQAVLVEEKT